jgi:hypothetical protein
MESIPVNKENFWQLFEHYLNIGDWGANFVKKITNGQY